MISSDTDFSDSRIQRHLDRDELRQDRLSRIAQIKIKSSREEKYFHYIRDNEKYEIIYENVEKVFLRENLALCKVHAKF